MGKEEGNNSDIGRGGRAFKLALNQGAAFVAKAADKTETKATGGDSNALHSSQFPDAPQNLSLRNNYDKDEEGDDYDKYRRDSNFGCNGEMKDGLGSDGTAPAEDSAAL